jgi:hypothetical protein
MKLGLFATLWSFLVCSSAIAQDGTVVFRNSSTSQIFNALTGTSVRGADSISVMLYMAPAGTTNEDDLVAVSSPVQVGGGVPGQYNAPGNPIVVPGFSAYSQVVIQVRAFETTYGSTYEQAVAAPPWSENRRWRR